MEQSNLDAQASVTEQLKKIMSDDLEQVLTLAKTTEKSKMEILKEVTDKSARKSHISLTNDGVTKELDGEDDTSVNENTLGNTNTSNGQANIIQFPDRLPTKDELNQERQEIQKRKANYRINYGGAEPAKPSDLKTPRIGLPPVSDKVTNPYDKEAVARINALFQQAANEQSKQSGYKEAVLNPETEWSEKKENLAYKSGVYSSNGKEITYKQKEVKVNWGSLYERSNLNPAEAIETLKLVFTEDIRKAFGGWDRITSIVVRDHQLFINNFLFTPKLDKIRKDNGEDIFPLDVGDYLENGCFADFFDWHYLRKMSKLILLDFDDAHFVASIVDSALKAGGQIGVSTFFYICPLLDTLIIGSELVNRKDLYTDKSVKIKENLASAKYSFNILEGVNLNICENTGCFQRWTFGNMVNYANNSKGKFLPFYLVGLGTRASVAGAAALLNVGTHLIRNIKNAFTEATTPVTEADMYEDNNMQ